MNKGLSLRAGFLIVLALCLSGASSCSHVPEGPRGIVGDAGCVYFDGRKPKNEQSYVLSFEECKNHIVIPADYYFVLEEWMARHCK